ncbi:MULTISPECIES: hypothetical protein [unclassified Microcoleus]
MRFIETKKSELLLVDIVSSMFAVVDRANVRSALPAQPALSRNSKY